MDAEQLTAMLSDFFVRCQSNPDAIPVLMLVGDPDTEIYSTLPAGKVASILDAVASNMREQASVAVH